MSLFNQEKAFEQYVGQYGDKRENKSHTEDKMKKAQNTALKMKEKGLSNAVGIELNALQKWLGVSPAILQ